MPKSLRPWLPAFRRRIPFRWLLGFGVMLPVLVVGCSIDPERAKPADGWSAVKLLAVGDPLISPGGTHELSIDGSTVRAVWLQSGRLYHGRSTDRGSTWTGATPIVPSGSVTLPFSLEAAGSDLHVFWADTRTGSYELNYKRSRDGGASWSTDNQLSDGRYKIDGAFRFATTISGSTLHVAWNPDRTVVRHEGGAYTWGDLFYRRSMDGGATWGAVNRLTTPDAIAVRPAIATFGNDVHVAWVDRRDANAVWDFQIYYRHSSDGGVTWTVETRMTDRPEQSRHPQLVAPLPGLACLIYESGWVWDGSRWGGDVGLFVVRTTDGGRTWQGPRRISFVNVGAGRSNHAKASAVGSHVQVTWTEDASTGRQAYYTESFDGCLTWGPDELLGNDLRGGSVAATSSYVVTLTSPEHYGRIYHQQRVTAGHRPATPSNLTARATSADRIELSWTDNSANRAGFKIERRGESSADFVQVAAVGAKVTTFVDRALTPDTRYIYRVRAKNSAGDSDYSDDTSAKTLSSGR